MKRKRGMTMTVEEIERKHQEDLRRIQNFRLMDDDFMTKCFEGDPQYIELVLRIILEMPNLKVIHVRTQVFVENLLNRSVRLDIVAVDSKGRRMNVEIQRSDSGAGWKRARYNSSMMDINLLEKGDKFDDLPEVWVIFITEHDVIGEGKPLYRIERCLVDTGKVIQDGSHILYVNGAYRGDTPLGKLMHDFSCKNPAEMNYKELADRVRFFKESKEGVAIMCKAIEDMRRQERQEGFEEGKGENMKEVALRMLRAGKYALDEISDMSGLPLDEIQSLKVGAMA